MSAGDDKVLELAARVSDGTPVDWEAEERDAGDAGLRKRIRHLRLVSDVASLHQTMDPHSQPTMSPAEMSTTVDMGSLKRDSGPVAQREAAPERWGRLEIRQKLGEGGFGEVYRAFDRNLDREVALKLLKKDAGNAERIEAVLAEGRMLARLRHPNVITVHGAETHDGRVGIWMEFVRGNTLAQLMRDQGRFGAREAALIGVELCRAMAAVHRAGLVHRDIKPENVMRDQDGRYLLMDFGAGQRLADLDDGSTRRISGTPLYIAPEIFLGQPAMPRSDVYSLGVLLYHLVTGAFPVVARSLEELRDEHRQRRARLLRDERSDLPEAFVGAVERALAWNPAERFETAGRMEQALTASLGVGTTPVSEPPVAEPEAPTPGAGKLMLGLAAVATLVLVGWFALKGAGGLPGPAGGSARTTASSSSPAAGAYTVQATLYRTRGDVRERLDSGDQLELGDRLTLEIQGSRDLYVYVLNEDATGNAFSLFPLPGMELSNPLRGNATHRLPGPVNGRQIHWSVTSPGEREHLIVLASPEPLVEFEQEMARLALPRPGAAAVAVPDAAKERLRGIGGLVEGETAPSTSSAQPLFRMARQLAGHAEQVEGVWLREIELANPAP